jgi:hypothetical protein
MDGRGSARGLVGSIWADSIPKDGCCLERLASWLELARYR